MIVEARGDVISLSGSLTENHWLTLKAACNLLLRRNPEGIIIDCGSLLKCTPEGAVTFKEAIHFIEAHEGRIILVNMPVDVLEVLQSVPGVRSVIALSKSMDEARASLKLGKMTRRPEKGTGPTIMVPLLGGHDARPAVHQASTVAKERNGCLVLVYVLVVPRSLALNAPLGEEEELASRTLEATEAMAQRESTVCSKYIPRARDLSQGLIDAAQHLGASVIVLSLPPSDTDGKGFGHVATALLDRAPCEVLINKPPAPAVAPAETRRLEL